MRRATPAGGAGREGSAVMGVLALLLPLFLLGGLLLLLVDEKEGIRVARELDEADRRLHDA